jgi:predicted amidohydrolase
MPIEIVYNKYNELHQKDCGEHHMKIRVAGAQIPVTRDINRNYEAICRAIDYAISENADILVTPEGSLSGYTNEFDNSIVDDRLERIVERAGKGSLGLALGTCCREKDDGTCYNQIRFYEKSGSYLGFHSKILLGRSAFEPDKPGEYTQFGVTPLKSFIFNGIKIGGLICNDVFANPMWTPYYVRNLVHELSEMGVKVLFHSVHAGRGTDEFRNTVVRNFHESSMRLRAKAGKLWFVTVDNCYPLDVPGQSPSGVINPEGNWEVQVPTIGEHYYAYTIDVD